MGTVEHERDDIAWSDLIITLYGFVVHMDKARIGSLLDTVPAGMLLMLREVLVDTDRLLSFVHLYPEVLIELAVAFRLTVGFLFGQPL